MNIYNIIYTSPSRTIYLWNGRSLYKLGSKDREALKFSGKSIKDEGRDEAMEKCREAAKQLFPEDADPKVKAVAVKVSN